MDNVIVPMLVILVIVGAVLMVILTLTKGKSGLLDQAKYRTAWLKIENGLDKSNEATYQFAVLAADRLVDQALKEIGVDGKTMGDRLKNSKKYFSDVNKVWEAHKVRNQIAHEVDAKINTLGLKRALAIFKKALKDLGAI